jgi:hypothetical protein
MLGDRAKDRSTPNRYVPAPIRNVRFTQIPVIPQRREERGQLTPPKD